MLLPFILFIKSGRIFGDSKQIVMAIIIIVYPIIIGFAFVVGWKKMSFLKIPRYYPESRPYDRRSFSVNPIGIIILFMIILKLYTSVFVGMILFPWEIYKYYRK